ncbi:craniofacial development protein 2-like [Daktulosphaira vitifoliae]|uniref:craniofacial development protein 2-like n=1 Tax=Daktulosphaira vitifoliae TaxID=58002 RepID=UPI0021AA9A36|nr:craniofacial development protein 2-like [Daktulosphaira vitifoliae]
MSSSQVKNSGGKIVPRSDLRVGTTREVRSVKDVKEYKRIATWNVRTLLQCGKLENLKIEMDKMKIDILGISELRWPKSGDFWSGDHRIIHTGASEKKPGTGGVGIIMNKNLGKKVKGYIQYDDRIILVKLQTKPKDTIVVQVYMPTSNSNDEEVEEVYENIDKIIENVKGEENLVVMGDWNTVVGEEKVNNVTGAFGLGT